MQFLCVCFWIFQNTLSGWRQKRNNQACLVLWENKHCKQEVSKKTLQQHYDITKIMRNTCPTDNMTSSLSIIQKYHHQICLQLCWVYTRSLTLDSTFNEVSQWEEVVSCPHLNTKKPRGEKLERHVQQMSNEVDPVLPHPLTSLPATLNGFTVTYCPICHHLQRKHCRLHVHATLSHVMEHR